MGLLGPLEYEGVPIAPLLGESFLHFAVAVKYERERGAPRVIARGADVIAAEDTRVTGVLVAHHGIRAQLLSLNEHNERRRVAEIIKLLDTGKRVALVTDGRMSGASGTVPAAIQVTPECLGGGELAKLRDGDVVRLDSHTGVLEALVPAVEMARRQPAEALLAHNGHGCGRELFAGFRARAGDAESGAMACL